MSPPHTTILGGGIMGASVAYHLAVRGATSTILESEPQAATLASGRAAGFLAGGWGDGSITERLHRTSFDMHAALAADLGLTSYRRLQTLKVDHAKAGAPPPVEWLDGEDIDVTLLDADTAQVDPAELSAALLREAQRDGLCTLRTSAEVVAITTAAADDNPKKRVAVGVELACGEHVACAPGDHVVVALGPWSCLVEEWLDIPLPMEGAWSTSITYRADGDDDAMRRMGAAPPSALFCAEDARGCHLEVYPRPNGDLYVSGCGETRVVSPQELRSGSVRPSECNAPDDTRADAAEMSLAALSSVWRGRRAETRQACIRPCAPDALPVLGPLPALTNMHVASGGSCWGILWAPAMGAAMAEMLLDDGETSVINCRAFAPRRFDTLTYRSLLKQRGRHGRATASGEAVGDSW